MDEKLKEALNSLATKSIEGIQSGITQIQIATPGLIDEFLRWKLAGSIFFFLFGLVFLYFFSKTWARFKKLYNSKEEYWNGNDIALCVLGCFCFLIGSVTSLVNLFDMLKIIIAPRIYLIDYAINVIGNKS